MPVKFYAAIPAAYITPDLPPGRYLVSAAGLWDRRRERFRWEKFDCLDPEEHEIIIDSGGFSFDEYPKGYIDEYNKGAKDGLAITVPDTFMQIDRLGDVAFTEAHRTPDTVPIVRADVEIRSGQLEKIVSNNTNCKFFAIGGLKKLKPKEAVHRLYVILSQAKLYKFERVHLLGAGLKIMKSLKQILSTYRIDLEISCDSGSWNSRFGSRINEFNAIMREKGWTQRETALRHYLPKYREEIES